MSARKPVAAFDVDGTLTTRDCVVPFLVAIAGWPQLGVGLSRRLHRLLPAAIRRDRDTIKALATEVVFTGRRAADVEEAGNRFASRILESWLRPDIVSTLRVHQHVGDEVVLVSASYGAYLRPLAGALGVGAVVCTELAVAPDGCCTGALDGGNCRGAAKVVRLRAWLDEHHGGRERVELWAYGDSAGDRAMLADADHACWVGRR